MYDIADLSNIGLMIHFRRDVDDRFRNLKTVLEYYREVSTGLEIIVVNDDIFLDKKIKSLCSQYGVKGLFMENNDVYWRTKAFNEASKYLNAEYIIAGDTDVIINPKYILKAKQLFEEDNNIGIVYPYNGMFVHVKQDVMNTFLVEKNLFEFEGFINTLKPKPYFETERFLVAHPQSKGGMVMFKKESFVLCKGYNTNFRGWGYEDDEILSRFQKLGYVITRVMDESAIAWHLPHDNTVREKHKYYENNRKHSDFVCGCSDKEQLLEYMKGWEI